MSSEPGTSGLKPALLRLDKRNSEKPHKRKPDLKIILKKLERFRSFGEKTSFHEISNFKILRLLSKKLWSRQEISRVQVHQNYVIFENKSGKCIRYKLQVFWNR